MKTNQTLPGTLSITGPSNGGVRIEIRDERSRTRFIEIKISHEELAKALMGLAERPVEMNLTNMDRVGKKRISEEIEAEVGRDVGYGDDRKEKAVAALMKLSDKLDKDYSGPMRVWHIDTSLSSRDSYFVVDGVTYARTTRTRWE